MINPAWLVSLLPCFASTTLALTDSFDTREATVDGIHNALFSRLTTCREVVSAFISRIEEFNPTVNAVISLNPDALSLADELDINLASGNATGSLFCVPVLLKDNYDAVGMNTTGSNVALVNNKPLADAPVVAAFKKAGAIILGKANLHELALEGLSVSSLGGQTVNPYDHTRTPGGSSGGTGAAIASNFAVLGTGTDTVNSMRSPASANSLFSFRPTRGLISRSGVIPISYTQDALGTMARNPKDLAVALTVMASVGYDPSDNVTAQIPPEIRNRDYSTLLYGRSLKGLRFGLLDGFWNHTASDETTPVNDVMAATIEQLTAAGVEMVNITETVYNALNISASLDVQTYEYRELLDEYLASSRLTGSPRPTSFNEIYTRDDFLVIPAQYNNVKNAFNRSTGDPAYFAAQRGIQNLTETLRKTFASNNLDAIIYPEQKNLVVKIGSPSQSGRNGILAALTGFPVVTVPVGFSRPTEDAPIGVPIGMEVLGRPWSEDLLLSVAQRIYEIKPVRRMPPFANGTIETKAYEEVPTIKPNRGNISPAYPFGTL